MENKKKYVLTAVAAFVALTMIAVPTVVSNSVNADAPTIVDSGIDGDIEWVLTSDGILTISGEGAIPDYYPSPGQPPWADYAPDIKKLIIEEGVTAVGAQAFSSGIAGKAYGITSIQIPDSVTKIGMSAFSQCYFLEGLTAKGKITIDSMAFRFCYSLKYIDLPNAYQIVVAFEGCYNVKTVTISQGTIVGGAIISPGTDSLIIGSVKTTVTDVFVSIGTEWNKFDMFLIGLNKITIDTDDEIDLSTLSTAEGKRLEITAQSVNTTGSTFFAADGVTELFDADRAGKTYEADGIGMNLAWVAIAEPDTEPDPETTSSVKWYKENVEINGHTLPVWSILLVAFFAVAVIGVGWFILKED